MTLETPRTRTPLLRWIRLVAAITAAAAAPAFHAEAGPIIIDHSCVDASRIPDAAMKTARALKLALRHASVGGNISDGLDDLASANSRYNRANLVFINRGNPGWQAKIDDLESFAAQNSAAYNVISMKFCFIDEDASWTAYRDAMVQLQAAYPGVTFVWWTMPIMTPSWSGDTAPGLRYAFNQNVRAWCASHSNAVLFDIADIESHNPAGTEVQDTDGIPAMYSDYSSDGGHLNTTGRDRVASAFWWMVARVSGWQPKPTVSDAADALRIASGLAAAPANLSSAFVARDCDGDKRITTGDAVRLLRNALAG